MAAYQDRITLLTEHTDRLTIAQASAYPITRAQLKTHLRIDFTAEDTYLDDIVIPAATEVVEGFLNRLIMRRQVVQTLPTFTSLQHQSLKRLPVVQASDVVITYMDSDGATQTLSTDVYGVGISEMAVFVYLKPGQSWPTTANEQDAVTVTYTAGYAGTDASPVNRDNIPTAIKAAIQMVAADLYVNRSKTIESSLMLQENPAAKALLMRYRRIPT